MMESTKMAYIGRKPCGCVCAAYVDEPPKSSVAKEVAKWIKWGLNVERVTVEYANEHFTWDCPHKPESAQLSLFADGEAS